MRKQCVRGSFLSAHALEPGNEARKIRAFLQERMNKMAPKICMKGCLASCNLDRVALVDKMMSSLVRQQNVLLMRMVYSQMLLHYKIEKLDPSQPIWVIMHTQPAVDTGGIKRQFFYRCYCMFIE